MNLGAQSRAKTVANESEKHPHIPARNVLDRIVLGGSDGAIEGLATTSALNGAGLGFGTIAVAGCAFAVAGAIAMFFSSYLSRRSELRSLDIDISRERMEIETEPDEEKSEMRELLKRDGYKEEEVDVIMQRLTKDKELWLKEMLRRELKVNIEDAGSDPFAWPLYAGAAFLLLALLAVSPYLFGLTRADALVASVSLSLGALFALGSRAFVPRNFDPMAGVESALVGGVAGGLLYLVGIVISTA
jgi:VIT1/CCC1 family predicted Fe2+/Mn2+ transporter